MQKTNQTAANSRPLPRLAVSLGLIAALTTTSLADKKTEGEEEKPRGAFPTLNILPEGSILRRVRLPRYDKDFKPLSLLEAEQLVVLENSRIQAEDVAVELYGRDGTIQARTKMRSAIYDQKKSTLHAKEAVYIEGATYVASGAGLVFHWDTRKGFLHGPASTKFYIQNQPDPQMKSTSALNPKINTPALAGSLMLISSSLIAAPPAPLSDAQLAELTKATKPLAPLTSKLRDETSKTIEEESTINRQATEGMRPFLKSIDKDTLLIQAPAANPEQPAAPQAPPKAKPNQSTLLVECDGGLYFDNDTGILAYLKNVRLTEERFKLTCRDELKVFLEKKPEPDPAADTNNEETSPTPSQKAEKADTEEDSMGSFGEVSRIVASGNVKLTRKDEQGRLFIATGETASYNAKTGEIILRGGRPRLQQSKNQFLQAQEPGQWIRVLKSGKLVTSNGKWKMVVVRDNPAPQP